MVDSETAHAESIAGSCFARPVLPEVGSGGSLSQAEARCQHPLWRALSVSSPATVCSIHRWMGREHRTEWLSLIQQEERTPVPDSDSDSTIVTFKHQDPKPRFRKQQWHEKWEKIKKSWTQQRSNRDIENGELLNSGNSGNRISVESNHKRQTRTVTSRQQNIKTSETVSDKNSDSQATFSQNLRKSSEENKHRRRIRCSSSCTHWYQQGWRQWHESTFNSDMWSSLELEMKHAKVCWWNFQFHHKTETHVLVSTPLNLHVSFICDPAVFSQLNPSLPPPAGHQERSLQWELCVREECWVKVALLQPALPDTSESGLAPACPASQ